MSTEDSSTPVAKPEPLRLHLGGDQVKEGWKILNIQRLPGVDFVGTCTDLSQFADNSVTEIYGSHIFEHLGYRSELPLALAEAYRVLKPGGLFRAGVPDLDTVSRLLIDPKRTIEELGYLLRVSMGGQEDEHDFHKTCFNLAIFKKLLEMVGFKHVRKVDSFALFNDTTELVFLGHRLSLNVVAMK